MRAAMCVVVRDLIVYGVIADMMRGRPAVYSTFSSYDEVAHHSGLERADTLEALRKLDQQFARIDRARKHAPRPYLIAVLSDHGQTQGATFKQRNGYGLDELVEKSLESGNVQAIAGGDEQKAMTNLAFEEATGTGTKKKQAKNEVGDRQVVVLGSGNLGLIYLMDEKRRLTLEEIDARHPRLITSLREHPHVGWLLVRSSERGAVVLGGRGTRYLDTGEVVGDDPLAGFSPHAAAAPGAHRRLRARGRRDGRELLRPAARGRLCVRGADLVPRRARRAADAAFHSLSGRAGRAGRGTRRRRGRARRADRLAPRPPGRRRRPAALRGGGGLSGRRPHASEARRRVLSPSGCRTRPG